MYLYIHQLINRYIRKPLKLFFADACIVSFPKSGRTQVRVFLSNYYSQKFGRPIDYMDDSLRARYYGAPRLLFSHEIVPGNPAKQASVAVGRKGRLKRKTMLLIRDPRDTLVSYYHHVLHRDSKRKVGAEAKKMDMSSFIRSSRFGMPALVKYLRIWVPRVDGQQGAYIVSYEDIQRDPRKTFKDILSCLGEKMIDEKAFEKAVEESSFKKMRSAEKAGTPTSSKLMTKSPDNPAAFKTRKGKTGTYKEELTLEDIAYLEREMSALPLAIREVYDI